MEIIYNVQQGLFDSLEVFWVRFVEYLPNLVAAIIVFFLGLYVAGIVGKIVAKVLNSIYLDRAVEKTGLKKNLEKVGFKIEISRALGLLVTWFLYAVVLIATAEILRLNQISEFLQSVVLYIPNVIIAVVILIVGTLIGNFVSLVVKEASVAASLESADLLAGLAKWAILIFSFMAALIQLRVAPELIQILFTGVVFMIALAGGIAFGLGGKDKAREILERLMRK